MREPREKARLRRAEEEDFAAAEAAEAEESADEVADEVEVEPDEREEEEHVDEEGATVVEEPDADAVVDEAPPGEHAGGELRIPEGYLVLEGEPGGDRRSVGVVVARFNGELTTQLLESALAELEERGVGRNAITVMPVPGAFELPLAAMALAKTRRYACIVALGCVIRGETPHFDYVAAEAASGLQVAALETGVPVAFGVLTVDTPEQSEARLDKAAEAVRTALEMAAAFASLRATSSGTSG